VKVQNEAIIKTAAAGIVRSCFIKMIPNEFTRIRKNRMHS